VTPERACELALECEAAALAVDPRITNSEGAGVSTHRGVRAYGNSHGFLGAYPGTVHSLSCAVIGAEGEEMERDYWYSTARDWRQLEAAATVGRRSGERAVQRLGARQLGTMRVPVLFAPEVARGLVSHFVGAVRGGSQYRRASFLLGAAGQPVFPDWFAHFRASAPAAGARERAVRPRGRRDPRPRTRGGRRAARLRAGTYSARKLGLRTTGNAGGTHNLLVHGRGRDFDGDAGADGSRAAGDRADGAGRQRRDRRLLARRRGLLGRERPHRLSRARGHRSPATCATCTAASSRSAPTWTRAAGSAPARSSSSR
jgi:PmbA protein